ncbi:phosphate ABC transporter substrate-binding protein [Enorma phocaeensis]|uniref:Phosphate ABC transporter substrate-binding protein n=1 Tax=Enorma phocaeensis TaxID=1871019 RepID=A0A921IS43_9ACTN|nr:phosphate ABC transporter substrate-binding protein [Enorma phocaeensis]HJG36777.1 phosphate ABC transporter substrate-binding protein [Enorma phocaeensis]
MFDQSCSRRSFLGLAGGVAAFAGLGLAGCGSAPASGSAAGGADAALSGTINCGGATAFQPLIEAVADEFMTENPDVVIAISGGGSGDGISGIVDGSLQIGRSDVFAEEKVDDESQLEGLVDNQVCIVGMGPIVNANVDIDDITTEQLAGIFTGQITDWSEVGGTAGTINVINREAGSGTRATFEAAVLQGAEVPADFTPVAEVDSSGTVVEQVAATEGSISYVAFNYYETNEGIKALNVDGVEPTQENVETGDFNIWAYEHMYTRSDEDEATAAITQAFIEYIMSEDVQSTTVIEQGFIPVSNMQVQKDVDGNVTPVE